MENTLLATPQGEDPIGTLLARPRVRLLGELTAEGEGSVSRAQSGRVATLLALLALEPGRVVSAARLISQLWEEDTPQSGLSTLYVYISRLRRQLEPLGIRLSTRPPGYALEVATHEVDAFQFTQAISRAEAALEARRAEEAQEWLDVAAGLWRGDPFQNAAASGDLALEAQRLVRFRDRVVEIEARCLLEQGLARRAADLARTLTDREPLNEALWALRMESEHALGNTGAALLVYEEFRTILSDALGIDPGRRIRDLHTLLLRADSPMDVPIPAEAVGQVPTAPADAADDEVIGREPHTRAIASALSAAPSGHGTVLVLEGGAGVGKTFLAEHAARAAEAAGFTVAWTRAVESTGAPPLWVWQRLLGQLPDAIETSGAADLAALKSATADSLSPDDATFRLADAIVSRVVDASHRRPLLIVIDDLQWADAPTLRAVSLLSSSVRASGCVVLLTVRHPEAQRMPFAGILATLTKESATRRLAVPAFTLDEVRRQVERALGDQTDASADLAQQLLERTGGNAYFLTELLAAGPGATLPTTVTELIELRVSELDVDAREILEAAAVDGLAVDTQLHTAVGGRSLLEVLRHLAGMCDVGLLRQDAGGFAFVHSLARDAVLSSLPPERVAHWHTVLARAIESVHVIDLDPHLERLAYHRYHASGGAPDESAYIACTAAADRARIGLAFDQAALFRARALEAMPRDDAEPRRRANALRLLTEDRRSAGDVQGASLSLRQALRAAHRLGEQDLAVEVLSLLGGVTLWNWRQFGEVDAETVELLESILVTSDGVGGGPLTPQQRVELGSALAMELYYGDAGQRRKARELTADAVDRAERLGNVELRSRAYSARVFALWRPGDGEERREAVRDWLLNPGSGEAVALLHRSSFALAEGDLTTWGVDMERLSGMVPRLGRAEYDAQYSAQLAAMAMQSGRFEDARVLIDRTYSILRRTSIWGGEWGRWVQSLTLSRLEGTVERFVDDLVAAATQDSNRALRWAAVIALAESARGAEARAMQARWNLRSMPESDHWGTEFEVGQAAEVALMLGTPLITDAYAAVSRLTTPLLVAGTGLAVIGSRDELLARLAERIGRFDDAKRHRERAHQVADSTAALLGERPHWPIAPPK